LNRYLGAVGAVIVTVSVLAGGSAVGNPMRGGAGSGTGTATATASAPQLSAAARTPRAIVDKQYARETARYGDADTSVYNIEHVRELQYRLGWANVYEAGATGNFGPLTQEGVKRYQKREGLRVTGVANAVTWKHLLRDTVRHRRAIPKVCKRVGWHACYDRSMHQVTLWRSGFLVNTWLVRGGDYTMQTRTGNTVVYYRDKDHTSHTFGGSPMPYAQFFDGGEAFHGSAFMIDPFDGHSHGCVNMYIEDARQLWKLTSTKRLHVKVYGAWD
jgi:Putative peptidoglycan binding domain/L,D-transpeptidase catalytic domain